MKYDFDELVERKGTGCVKWDERPDADVDPSLDLIPLWVADMDFKAAPAILEAVPPGSVVAITGLSSAKRSSIRQVLFLLCR